MQDKVLRTYAEMENVMGRTRREAENSKKFAIQVLSFDPPPPFFFLFSKFLLLFGGRVLTSWYSLFSHVLFNFVLNGFNVM